MQSFPDFAPLARFSGSYKINQLDSLFTAEILLVNYLVGFILAHQSGAVLHTSLAPPLERSGHMLKNDTLPKKKSDLTRLRLLEAAMEEFALYGFAGARVDRIAELAKCNKQAIYAYYESKEGLFDAVFQRMVDETIHAVPIDAFDLPKYAAGLFDHYRLHPEVLRLGRWHALERETTPPKAAIDAAVQKVAAIVVAQEAGAVTRQYRAEEILELVLSLSKVGAEGTFEGGGSEMATASLRRSLIDAVKKVVAP